MYVRPIADARTRRGLRAFAGGSREGITVRRIYETGLAVRRAEFLSTARPLRATQETRPTHGHATHVARDVGRSLRERTGTAKRRERSTDNNNDIFRRFSEVTEPICTCGHATRSRREAEGTARGAKDCDLRKAYYLNGHAQYDLRDVRGIPFTPRLVGRGAGVRACVRMRARCHARCALCRVRTWWTLTARTVRSVPCTCDRDCRTCGCAPVPASRPRGGFRPPARLRSACYGTLSCTARATRPIHMRVGCIRIR